MHGHREAKKEAWNRMEPETREVILENLGFNGELRNIIRSEEAAVGYEKEGSLNLRMMS